MHSETQLCYRLRGVSPEFHSAADVNTASDTCECGAFPLACSTGSHSIGKRVTLGLSANIHRTSLPQKQSVMKMMETWPHRYVEEYIQQGKVMTQIRATCPHVIEIAVIWG